MIVSRKRLPCEGKRKRQRPLDMLGVTAVG